MIKVSMIQWYLETECFSEYSSEDKKTYASEDGSLAFKLYKDGKEVPITVGKVAEMAICTLWEAQDHGFPFYDDDDKEFNENELGNRWGEAIILDGAIVFPGIKYSDGEGKCPYCGAKIYDTEHDACVLCGEDYDDSEEE